MATAAKELFIENMRKDLTRAQGVLFVNYTGLTVAQADSLRKNCREAGVKYQVVKNTLMSRVLSGTSMQDAAQCLKGTPTGVVISFEDPVTPAKLSFAFAKECERFKVKGGVVDNKSISVQQAETLSKLPSQKELVGQVISLALSPGGNIAGQIKGAAGRIVGAIDALADKLTPD